MPYSGITPGSDLEKKIDRCVLDVMADDPKLDKSSAIAICRASIKKKEVEMSKGQKTRKGKTARQRRKEAHRKLEEVLEAAEEQVEDILDEAMTEEESEEDVEEDVLDEIMEGNIEVIDEIPEDTDASEDELTDILVELASEEDVEEEKSVDVELSELVSEVVQKVVAKIRSAAKKVGIGQAKKKQSALTIIKNTKDVSGDFPYRWVGKVSGNFKDRDGEIITQEAHEEYVSWLHEKVFDKRPELAPEFRTWHTPGTGRKARADAAAFLNGFLVMSGPLTRSEAHALVKASEKNDLGMSHGFIGVKESNYIVRYRSYEVSDLPVKFAAYPWSSLETIQKEALTMSKDKIKHLKAIVGDEIVEELLEDTELKQAALRDLDIDEKDVKEEETPPVEEAETQEKSTKEEAVGKVIEALLPVILKEIGIEDLSEYVEETRRQVEENTKALAVSQKDDADRLAQMIEAPASRQYAWSSRASQAQETVLNEKDAEDQVLKSSGPGAQNDENWLSALTNTQPLQEDEALVQ